MTQQAEAQRSEIVSQAKAEAGRIDAHARTEAADARERALRAAEADLAAAAQRGRERAEAEAHMLVLTTKDTIAQQLTMRAFMEELRGSGVDTGGPAAFSQADRQRFANALDRELARR